MGLETPLVYEFQLDSLVRVAIVWGCLIVSDVRSD